MQGTEILILGGRWNFMSGSRSLNTFPEYSLRHFMKYLGFALFTRVKYCETHLFLVSGNSVIYCLANY